MGFPQQYHRNTIAIPDEYRRYTKGIPKEYHRNTTRNNIKLSLAFARPCTRSNARSAAPVCRTMDSHDGLTIHVAHRLIAPARSMLAESPLDRILRKSTLPVSSFSAGADRWSSESKMRQGTHTRNCLDGLLGTSNTPLEGNCCANTGPSLHPDLVQAAL